MNAGAFARSLRTFQADARFDRSLLPWSTATASRWTSRKHSSSGGHRVFIDGATVPALCDHEGVTELVGDSSSIDRKGR